MAISDIKAAVTPERIVEVTQDLLTMAGIGVATGDGAYPDPGPDSGINVPQPDLFTIASDIRTGEPAGRVTLGDFADTLVDLGVPLGTTSERRVRMVSFLRFLRATADDHVGEPGMKAIEVFFALRAAKGQGVELADPLLRADDIGLDIAELTVLEGIIARTAGLYVEAAPVEPSAPSNAMMVSAAAVPDPPAEEPPGAACQATRVYLEKNVPLAGPLFAYTVGKATEAGVLKYHEKMAEILGLTGASAAKYVQVGGLLFNGLGILAKLQTLAMVFASVQATAKTLTNEIVIDRPSAVEPDVQLPVELKVGVPDAEWNARKSQVGPFLLAVRNCAAEFGVPVPSSELDLTGDIDKWRSQWQIIGGSEHAKFAPGSVFDIPGQQANYIKPIDDHTGGDAVLLQLEEESVEDAAGQQSIGILKVRSRVQTDKPPAFATYLQVAIATATGGPFGVAIDALGIVAGVLDIMIGWFQNVRTIDAYAGQRVRFHHPNAQWYGTIIVTGEQRIRQSGSNELGSGDRRGRETAGTKTLTVSRTVFVITGVKSEDTASGKVTLTARSAGWMSTDHDSWLRNVGNTPNSVCQQLYGLNTSGTYEQFEQILVTGQEHYAVKSFDIELELAPDGSWSLEKLERGLQQKVTAASFVQIDESSPGCGLPPRTPQRTESFAPFGFSDFGGADSIVTQVGFLDRNRPGNDLTVGRGDPVVVDYDLTNPGRFQEGYYQSHRETDVEVNLHRRGGIVLPSG